jgi:hypothetical protein
MFLTALYKVCFLSILLHGNKAYMEVNQYTVLLDLKSSILREVSCPRDPKAVLFRLAKFLSESLITVQPFSSQNPDLCFRKVRGVYFNRSLPETRFTLQKLSTKSNYG